MFEILTTRATTTVLPFAFDPRKRGGETVRENLSIDDVVRAINARDEKSLGADHAPREMKEGRNHG